MEEKLMIKAPAPRALTGVLKKGTGYSLSNEGIWSAPLLKNIRYKNKP
jgi:hypothetical protein